MVKDQQELTQTTQSSDMVSGTSLLTTGQVSEKRIWSVARNIYYSLQSKITEFLRKDLQRSDTTLGSIQIFTYQSSPASQRASLGHLEVNQSSVTPGGNDACVDIPHKLLPKTTELSGSMLEDIDTIRCRSADSQNTRNTSSSRSSISLTPTSKLRQSKWHFALPGTPIPTEDPAQIDFPIVRNTIIEDFFHTEDLLPVTFVEKVRQAAGVVVDIMVESVENTQENGQGASHLDDLRSAVRKLRKIISTWTIHIFSHELVDKVIAIQDSHSTPQVLTLEAAKSASDSILSRLKWGKEQCAISKELSSQLLQIFAEETVKCFLRQWSDEYENINFDVSVQNDPKTSTCMVILQMITKATAKCYFESATSVATSDIVEGVFDLERDTISSTGEQVNTKGSKNVSKNLCPQESLEYQPQNISPTVYFTETMTISHGSFSPEGIYDIASSFPLEEKSRKPSLFTRLSRSITKGFLSTFKSSRKTKLFK
ncbi:uncharacterized protein LOC118948927 [Oncorhynchus mykiss]|uniref:uncharacterized protein LOC118948927 n=1 Tax=Oncorhynchus mykiss TaxID=8022 RepID=UPI001877916E|nr:uncharacterized protein LOC118948927 [Oncorhynchus mykiss]